MTGPTTPSSPAPASGHDTGLRTAELDFAGQFLLWGMRAWLMAHRHDKDCANAYRGMAGEGFLRAGVPQGMDLIDDIFSILAAAALPSLISLAVLLRDAELTIAPLDAETCDAPDLRIALAHANATAPVH